MQIVIEISETLKQIADEEDFKTFSHFMWQSILMDAIKNGQPLLKGHGRLFDERDIVNGNYEVIGNRIYELEPIIEADRSEEE